MSQPRCSLLVVDDEQYIQDILAALLADRFEVYTAGSAAAARVIFSKHSIDLILSDQRMPGESGAELLGWVRENSPRTICMMMTGFTDFDNTVQAVNRGQLFRIILKPWRSDELLTILDSAARTYHIQRSHDKLLEDLRQLNAELEERVQVRTWELEEAVRQLEQRNTMLEKLSLTDPLTGLPNRRAVDRVADAELRRRARHPGPLALGMIDADHFKEINTRHLLPGGDQVLIHLARTLAGSLRAEDTVARVGGEEFLVLAPETGLEGATALAERLRSAVEQKRAIYRGEEIGTTVSIGFAVAEAGVPATYAQMKEVAAAALAEAKSAGRNRCLVTAVPPRPASGS